MAAAGWLLNLGFAGTGASFTVLDTTDGEFGEEVVLPALPLTIEPHTRQALTEAFRRMSIAFNQRGYRARTTTTSVVATDDVVLVDASASVVTVTLMSASKWPHNSIAIKKLDGGSNAVKVVAQSGETIDGTATQSLAAQYAVLRVASNGVGWHVI